MSENGIILFALRQNKKGLYFLQDIESDLEFPVSQRNAEVIIRLKKWKKVKVAGSKDWYSYQ